TYSCPTLPPLPPATRPPSRSSIHRALPHRSLPSLPTRRSSDLIVVIPAANGTLTSLGPGEETVIGAADLLLLQLEVPLEGVQIRSEEHTFELQSPCNLVCRLLLEKKNKLWLARDDDCRAADGGA